MFSTLLKIPYLKAKYKYFPDKAQKFWAQELLNSQGLSAKLGQVLAQGKESELPKSSIPVAKAEALFRKTFPGEVEFSQEVFAASMGQVFFARRAGQELAIKLLHPGIKDKLRSEIDNVLLLGGYFAKTNRFTFNRDVFRAFLTEVFQEETDLTREGQFQEKFLKIFDHDERFKVPHVIRELSSSDFLTQELVRARLARDLKTFPHHHIFDFFFTALLDHGVLHGDLNDRNWGLTQNDTVAVYDYGCSQIVSGRRINGLKKLLQNDDVVAGFLEFGIRLEATPFKGHEQELRDRLFGPLIDRPIAPDLAYSEDLQRVYGDKIKSLREFTDPWVLLMMRSLFSLIRVYQDRKVSIPLGEVLSRHLQLKDEPMKATAIKIEVLEDGKQVVFMTLPMSALDNMEGLMPEKVTERIHQERINLNDLIAKVKASGHAPQELFHLSIERRSYKVWVD